MEPDTIMEKVTKASGMNYNFHNEGNKFQDAVPQAPVVSSSEVLVTLISSIEEKECRNKITSWALRCLLGVYYVLATWNR